MLDTLKRWLKIGSPQPPGDPITFPYTHTAPDGDLTVTVHSLNLHRIDTVFPCWVYESKGLMAFGQEELLFLLKREPGEAEEDFPRDPLSFFAEILRFARDEKFVQSGDITQFRVSARSFCGSHCLLYSFVPERLAGLPELQTPTDDMLLCHLLNEDEREAAKAWGGNRVLSRLGHAAVYYPFPDWNERKRKPLPVREEISQSVVTKTHQLRLPQATVYFEGGNPTADGGTTTTDGLVTLRIPASVLSGIVSAFDRLPDSSPLAIITGWEPSATGCFVWWAGRKDALAITPPGGGNARISGNFLILSTEEDVDTVRPFEDGFVVILTLQNYRRVLQSLRDAKPITLATSVNRFSLYYPH